MRMAGPGSTFDNNATSLPLSKQFCSVGRIIVFKDKRISNGPLQSIVHLLYLLIAQPFHFPGPVLLLLFFSIKKNHEPCWIYFQICLFTTWISIIHFTLPYLSFNYNTFSDACYDWYIKAGEPSVSPRDLNRNKLLKYKCLKFPSVIMIKQDIKVDTSLIFYYLK